MMSFISRKRDKYHSRHLFSIFSSASIALLLGQANAAQSAIFEQLENGTLVEMDGGVSTDGPPAQPDASAVKAPTAVTHAVLTGYVEDQTGGENPAGSVLLNLDPKATVVFGRANHPAFRLRQRAVRLPNPRPMTQLVSVRQWQMRRLTAEVGRAYTHTPGVIRAKLNRESFISLFTAMIHRESNFNPRAVSSAGAKGLGQLMPATSRELGVCDPFSARDNLHGAARYLTAMLDQFGTPELALAAYNAGPGAVHKYGGVPPYRETHQYIADILHVVRRAPLADTGTDPQAPPSFFESVDRVRIDLAGCTR